MSMPYANILSSINSSSFKQERLSILQTNKYVTEYMITRYPVLRLGYRSSALNNSYSRLRDSINTYVNVRNNILYNISYSCYIQKKSKWIFSRLKLIYSSPFTYLFYSSWEKSLFLFLREYHSQNEGGAYYNV